MQINYKIQLTKQIEKNKIFGNTSTYSCRSFKRYEIKFRITHLFYNLLHNTPTYTYIK